MRGRKRWIAFFHHPKGTLVVDAGAKKALRESGKSLLPPGITRCEGDFAKDDVVRICDEDGTEFARGIARFHSVQIADHQLPREEVIGQTSAEFGMWVNANDREACLHAMRTVGAIRNRECGWRNQRGETVAVLRGRSHRLKGRQVVTL